MNKLGFGTMRLPMPNPKEPSAVDMDAVCRLVDRFLEKGCTYFDTAYVYHGGESERIVRKALVERHPRESFTIADKMPVFNLTEATEEEQARIFEEQLEKCGVDYFDYYLVHSLYADTYETAKRLRTFAYLEEQKAQGRIRQLGFSFHDTAEVLEQILTDHPHVDFVQLQLNYLDWEDERIQSRKCYETARRFGIPITVMEPVKGGKLSAVPEEVTAAMTGLHPDWTPSAWAVRYVAGLEGVQTVLSGMNALSQIDDNAANLQDTPPMTAEEREVLRYAADVLSRLPAIGCTACRYCVEGCPSRIPIPDLFSLYNSDQLLLRCGKPVRTDCYQQQTAGGGLASQCVECRQCETICPQHLPVIKWLKRVSGLYEKA